MRKYIKYKDKYLNLKYLNLKYLNLNNLKGGSNKLMLAFPHCHDGINNCDIATKNIYNIFANILATEKDIHYEIITKSSNKAIPINIYPSIYLLIDVRVVPPNENLRIIYNKTDELTKRLHERVKTLNVGKHAINDTRTQCLICEFTEALDENNPHLDIAKNRLFLIKHIISWIKENYIC